MLKFQLIIHGDSDVDLTHPDIAHFCSEHQDFLIERQTEEEVREVIKTFLGKLQVLPTSLNTTWRAEEFKTTIKLFLEELESPLEDVFQGTHDAPVFMGISFGGNRHIDLRQFHTPEISL